jgi:hypothetical protein
MLIEAGFDVAFECPAPTPMILQLSDALQHGPPRAGASFIVQGPSKNHLGVARLSRDGEIEV